MVWLRAMDWVSKACTRAKACASTAWVETKTCASATWLRAKAWGNWLPSHGIEALAYVVLLAFVVWLAALLFESTVRKIDALSAAAVAAGSDFYLDRKECEARAKSRALALAQRPAGLAPEAGKEIPVASDDDCQPHEAAGSRSYTGSTPRADKWDVTVVLFGDADLDALGLPYPVPYQTHADVLEMLLAHKPAAIFVDFMFLQEREPERAGAEALRDVLIEARRQNVPVVMALPDQELLKLDEASTDRKTTPWLVDRFTGCTDFAALTALKPEDSLGLIQYPAGSDAALRVEPATAGNLPSPTTADVRLLPLASPAFAIADALSRREAAAGRAAAAGDTAAGNKTAGCLTQMPAAWAGADHRPPSRPTMEILWRTGVNERHSSVKDCGREQPTTEESRGEYLHRLWMRVQRTFNLLSEGYSPTFCPSQRVVSVDALLAGAHDEAGRRAHFNDRVIVYGANFLGALDAVKTPAGSHTPGVFVHAMAIHNLLLLGEDGYKVDSRWRRWAFDAMVAFTAALFAVRWRKQGKPRDFMDSWARPRLIEALSAQSVTQWVTSPDHCRLAKGIAVIMALAGFVTAIYFSDRIVAVALIVLAFLLWKLSLGMLLGYAVGVSVVTWIGFTELRQGSLGILLALGLLLFAQKVDERVDWLTACLDKARDGGATSASNWAASVISFLDRLQRASKGPPSANPPAPAACPCTCGASCASSVPTGSRASSASPP